MHGLLLFAHGARDPAWAQPFERLAALVRERSPDQAVVLGYLELMSPNLDAAVQALVEQGCTALTVVPLFLGSGGHVKRDLPRLIDELRQRHPGLSIQATPAIGESEAVIQALATATLALAAAPSP